jgi:hypothetical protein
METRSDCTADAVDSPKAPASDDRIPQAWSKVRSILHESGYRFNSRYAQRKHDGVKTDPQETLEYLITVYERTAAMTVKTVTDHESAVACCTELDNFFEKMRKISSKLLRKVFPQESRETFNVLNSELRRRLLPRSEHWKAEAHRLARKVRRTRRSESTPVAVRIMRSAMQQQGLTPPKLAVKILAILRRTRQTKIKVDRTTIYRIVGGKTRNPQPAIRNALIKALQLSPAINRGRRNDRPK